VILLKTKREIVEWWKQLGNHPEWNNLRDFHQKISKETNFEYTRFRNGDVKIKLTSKKWGKPLTLFFDKDGEGIAITGFN
jgi:hypothetical protein